MTIKTKIMVKATRAQVAEESEGRCALAHSEHGRCARSVKSEDHHIIRRGEGGTDELENRVRVCPDHHRQIHQQQAP